METSVYQINKGINRSIEFRGLKAQYIWYVAAGVLVLVVIYALLYVLGINQYIGIGFILILGTVFVIKVYDLSNRYGEHGMMKLIASKRVPKVLKNNSRRLFIQLNRKGKG